SIVAETSYSKFPLIFTMRSFLVFAIVLALVAACHAESFSMSCVTGAGGKMECKRVYSATGSESHSAAGGGETYAEAGGAYGRNEGYYM
ncbi:hypothetical protein AVEN_15984-1, partial [Araneus ventricosus]